MVVPACGFVRRYPAICALILTKYKFLIMEDQLLRAQNMGRTRLDNPHAYVVPARCR